MIYLDLLLGFLKVGLFSFGGAYSAIPLIRDVVTSYGWLSDDELSTMIAISESTPGPIMVNLATYVGSSQGGILGAALATFAVVLPAFVIILLLMAALKPLLKNNCVKAVMLGLTACITGIILATGVSMAAKNILPDGGFDIRAVIITAILVLAMLISKYVFKKKLTPILLIAFSAVLGIVVYL